MAQTFPPHIDYASVSIRDLIEARDANHVYLSTLPNVVATAIGRYLIRHDDWYANNSPNTPRPTNVRKPTGARTLDNSVIRPWSWPAVLVFVREWAQPGELGVEEIPKALYLPDGRVAPTCVVRAEIDERIPPALPVPVQTSGLAGGGFACVRAHQGTQHQGTLGCLVRRDGTYYALTNRHVAGLGGERVSTFSHGSFHEIGTATDIGLGDIPVSTAFPQWPGTRTYLTMDAGLIRIDNINDWTSQAWGIGEIGEVFDATERSVTLDLIGCPVRGYGATSGVLEGEIRALFFRYESIGGFERSTDVLIGPRIEHRTPKGPVRIHHKDQAPPFTQPGDSGTLWFYDPPPEGDMHPDVGGHAPPDRGLHARRLRPVAMQWGGEQLVASNGSGSAFALSSFLSTILRELQVEIERDWSTGHDEYWGKIGHFAIGWKACDIAGGNVGKLMQLNQERVGFNDKTLKQGAALTVDRTLFVPLADVPDYVWIGTRQTNEPMQHFADIDIFDINGHDDMLKRCVADPKNISAMAWKTYFDGFANAKVGPDQGTLPFRVWQIWEDMVGYLKKKDGLRFVAAAGILAHYVGDASQPLHCSYLHHGVPPMLKHGGRKYPVPKKNPLYDQFHKTPPSKIHGIYEEGMLEVDTAAVLIGVNERINKLKGHQSTINSGHDAARALVDLMAASQKRLAPMDIIKADDPTLTEQERGARLWKNQKIRTATIALLSDSVRLLADLWESAWRVGNGDALAKAKRREYLKEELEPVYRKETNFLPSLSLAKMASSKRFEP